MVLARDLQIWLVKSTTKRRRTSKKLILLITKTKNKEIKNYGKNYWYRLRYNQLMCSCS